MRAGKEPQVELALSQSLVKQGSINHRDICRGGREKDIGIPRDYIPVGEDAFQCIDNDRI
ncbi:MAG: hypothetical protein DDT25_00592 [Chloroflexi bacterium]|nr:hypothetical protein [Chloroflexota bacterium]